MNVTARYWLKENGYNETVDLIEEVLLIWHEKGSKERRNWWDVLAGTKKGIPRIIAGKTFPILWVARERKGWGPVIEMIGKIENEIAPSPKKNGRWS